MIAWVVLVLALVGALVVMGVWRAGDAAARDAARREAYLPIDRDHSDVYRITRELSRRIMDQGAPRITEHHGIEFIRMRMVHDATTGRSRFYRSAGQVSMAAARVVTSEVHDEELSVSDAGIEIVRPGMSLPLVPPISSGNPGAFSLTFGSTRERGTFFGWPLLEDVDLGPEDVAAWSSTLDAIASRLDPKVLFNPLREETLRFFQARGPTVGLAGRKVGTVRLDYTGQLTKNHVSHQVRGALFLGSGLGILKEERDVTTRVYPAPKWDESAGRFVEPDDRVAVFTAHATRILIPAPEGI